MLNGDKIMTFHLPADKFHTFVQFRTKSLENDEVQQHREGNYCDILLINVSRTVGNFTTH